jgi:hypothetical protein
MIRTLNTYKKDTAFNSLNVAVLISVLVVVNVVVH